MLKDRFAVCEQSLVISALFCTVIFPNISVFSIKSQYLIEDLVFLLFSVCQYSVHPGATTPTGAKNEGSLLETGEKH